MLRQPQRWPPAAWLQYPVLPYIHTSSRFTRVAAEVGHRGDLPVTCPLPVP